MKLPNQSRFMMLRYVAALFILYSCSFCLASGHKQQLIPTSIFKILGENIYTVGFPHTQRSLVECYRSKNNCAQTYENATKALRTIFSRGKEVALDSTLHTFKTTCPKKRAEPNYACRAATNSLYFFHSKSEDEKILNYFKTVDPKIIVSNLPLLSPRWIFDRKYKKEWASFIGSLDGFSKLEKMSLSQNFAKGGGLSGPSSITYLDDYLKESDYFVNVVNKMDIYDVP